MHPVVSIATVATPRLSVVVLWREARSQGFGSVRPLAGDSHSSGIGQIGATCLAAACLRGARSLRRSSATCATSTPRAMWRSRCRNAPATRCVCWGPLGGGGPSRPVLGRLGANAAVPPHLASRHTGPEVVYCILHMLLRLCYAMPTHSRVWHQRDRSVAVVGHTLARPRPSPITCLGRCAPRMSRWQTCSGARRSCRGRFVAV